MASSHYESLESLGDDESDAFMYEVCAAVTRSRRTIISTIKQNYESHMGKTISSADVCRVLLSRPTQVMHSICGNRSKSFSEDHEQTMRGTSLPRFSRASSLRDVRDVDNVRDIRTEEYLAEMSERDYLEAGRLAEVAAFPPAGPSLFAEAISKAPDSSTLVNSTLKEQEKQEVQDEEVSEKPVENFVEPVERQEQVVETRENSPQNLQQVQMEETVHEPPSIEPPVPKPSKTSSSSSKKKNEFAKVGELPACVVPEECTKCTLVDFVSPDEFSLIFLDRADLKKLQENMSIYLETVEPVASDPSSIAVNLPVIVRIGDDVHRAVITNYVDACQLVDVRLFDDGKTVKKVKTEVVYRIPNKFITLPMQALACAFKLRSTLGDTWIPSHLAKIKKLAEKWTDCFVVDQHSASPQTNPLYVDIYRRDLGYVSAGSLVLMLLKKELAHPADFVMSDVDLSDVSVGTLSKVDIDSDEEFDPDERNCSSRISSSEVQQRQPTPQPLPVPETRKVANVPLCLDNAPHEAAKKEIKGPGNLRPNRAPSSASTAMMISSTSTDPPQRYGFSADDSATFENLPTTGLANNDKDIHETESNSSKAAPRRTFAFKKSAFGAPPQGLISQVPTTEVPSPAPRSSSPSRQQSGSKPPLPSRFITSVAPR